MSFNLLTSPLVVASMYVFTTSSLVSLPAAGVLIAFPAPQIKSKAMPASIDLNVLITLLLNFICLVFSCLDGQKCFLPAAFNNLFDPIPFISNGGCHLFGIWVFQGVLINRLDFCCNGRECWANGIK